MFLEYSRDQLMLERNSFVVLIVDDDEMWRLLARLAFERAGLAALEADSVASAKQLLDKHPDITAIVADLQMPEESGVELCRHVRGVPRLAQIPVVIMTGSNDPSALREVRDAGADVTLLKGTEFRQLVSVVQSTRH